MCDQETNTILKGCDQNRICGLTESIENSLHIAIVRKKLSKKKKRKKELIEIFVNTFCRHFQIGSVFL